MNPDYTSNDLLPNDILTPSKSRKELLPLWIKIFAWIFLVLGALSFLAIPIGLITHNFSLSLYGIETNYPFSITGIFLLTIFLFKAATAFGLLWKKDWGVLFAMVDAIIGIAACSFVMLYGVFNEYGHFTFRLELALLIPYLIKMKNIKSDWAIAAVD